MRGVYRYGRPLELREIKRLVRLRKRLGAAQLDAMAPADVLAIISKPQKRGPAPLAGPLTAAERARIRRRTGKGLKAIVRDIRP